MLKQNMANLLPTRGVKDASRYLVQQGMKYHTVNRILTGKVDTITYTKMNFILGQCSRAEIQARLLCGWYLVNTDWTDYKVTSVLCYH